MTSTETRRLLADLRPSAATDSVLSSRLNRRIPAQQHLDIGSRLLPIWDFLSLLMSDYVASLSYTMLLSGTTPTLLSAWSEHEANALVGAILATIFLRHTGVEQSHGRATATSTAVIRSYSWRVGAPWGAERVAPASKKS